MPKRGTIVLKHKHCHLLQSSAICYLSPLGEMQHSFRFRKINLVSKYHFLKYIIENIYTQKFKESSYPHFLRLKSSNEKTKSYFDTLFDKWLTLIWYWEGRDELLDCYYQNELFLDHSISFEEKPSSDSPSLSQSLIRILHLIY